MHQKRTKVWIDPFQTRFFWRIASRFLVYQVLVWALVIFGSQIHRVLATMFDPTMADRVIWLLTGAGFLVGFLIIYDAVKFTHRVVGPVVAFRRACRALRDNDNIALVRLREGDFLQDLKEEFNEMLKALEQRGVITLEPTADKSSEAKQSEPAAMV